MVGAGGQRSTASQFLGSPHGSSAGGTGSHVTVRAAWQGLVRLYYLVDTHCEGPGRGSVLQRALPCSTWPLDLAQRDSKEVCSGGGLSLSPSLCVRGALPLYSSQDRGIISRIQTAFPV